MIIKSLRRGTQFRVHIVWLLLLAIHIVVKSSVGKRWRIACSVDGIVLVGWKFPKDKRAKLLYWLSGDG